MTDKEKLDAIKAEIHRLVDVRGYDREMANDLLAFMNSLPNEHVSEDFEVEVKNLWEEINTGHSYSVVDSYNLFYGLCMDIADWQKENLWKPADGEDLPEINREVIALLGWGKVVFAHRPPEFWDGKDIVTGKVTRKFPMTYDKGGWNQPDVKWWLDCSMPKEIEL
jgi:hypothetical protein